MSLPDDLTAALDAFLSGASSRQIRGSAAGLSARYRSRGSAAAPIVASAEDTLAYVAYRLPATFAAVHASLGGGATP